MTANQNDGRAGAPDLTFKRFAPGAEHVHVPTSSKKAALAGIAFYTACRPQPVRAQKMAWLGTRLLGPRVIPGRSMAWEPPMQAEEWDALVARWRRWVSGFDTMAVAYRGGAESGLRILLLRDGEPRAVAKVHSMESGRCGREEEALRLMAESRPRTFRVPGVMASGQEGGWCYLLLRPLPAKIHRVPEAPPLTSIVGEIHTGLSGLRRPDHAPHHWHAMHGELTPWTLRELPDGTLVLLDWEGVTWAPPGADEVLYKAAAAAITGRLPGPIHVREAVEFWRRRALSEEALSHQGPDFPIQFLGALDAMTANASPGGPML